MFKKNHSYIYNIKNYILFDVEQALLYTVSQEGYIIYHHCLFFSNIELNTMLHLL